MRTVSVALLLAGLALSASADTYQIDQVHSSVHFRVKHLDTAWFYGRFNGISGGFELAEDAADCSFEVTVDAATVDTNNEARERHLLGEDFFNAAEFPSISFVSTAVEKTEEGYAVTGDFTLHGVTKEITVPVEVVGFGEFRGTKKAGLHAVFTIKRSDYGMEYMLGALSDEVMLVISLEGDLQ